MHNLIKLLLLIPVINVLFSQSNLSYFFQQKEWQSTIIGISVKDVNTKQTLLEYNSHIQLVPASTFKLLVTAVVLEKLGANFRFSTPIYINGKIQNNTLYGDLIIQGKGDPTIESRFFQSPKLSDFVEILKKNNIQKINGKIIFDASYTQSDINDNWIWEDINNYYTAIPYAFNIYDNEYHIFLQSESENNPVKVIRIEPQYVSKPFIEITENSLIAKGKGDNAYIFGDPLGYTKRLKGSIPPFQKEYSIEGSLPNSTRMFVEQLVAVFQKHQILFQQSEILINSKDSLNYSALHLIGEVHSPPLSEIIRLTNLHSINLFAEAMLFAIGNGNYEQGKIEVINFLKKLNTNTNEINIDDACGLSRLNGISTDALCQLLVQMYVSKRGEVFLKSLPVAGENGTMKNFSDTFPLKGNLRCKTGYIQRVRTYSGYMTTKSGKTLAVCVFFNNFNNGIEKIKHTTKIFFETLYQNF
ncbi:MAG: D-alanyl-D-alanine carboxypeptidase DacB [Bacteroidia bacterium]|nr:MAG: D-alanyl-D-alanine carboxypeptidase DacB [Bacteroidia bacterium]